MTRLQDKRFLSYLVLFVCGIYIFGSRHLHDLISFSIVIAETFPFEASSIHGKNRLELRISLWFSLLTFLRIFVDIMKLLYSYCVASHVKPDMVKYCMKCLLEQLELVDTNVPDLTPEFCLNFLVYVYTSYSHLLQ